VATKTIADSEHQSEKMKIVEFPITDKQTTALVLQVGGQALKFGNINNATLTI